MTLQKPIVVVGSINIDLVAISATIPRVGETLTGLDFAMHPGGKGANQAVAVARLGYPVRMIGRVGDDAFAAQLTAHLRQSGVDLHGVSTSPGTSGVAMIVVASSGENSIVVTPGANALLSAQDLDSNIELIRSAAIVLTQLETPLETVLHLAEICEREGVPLMLDPAPARTLPRQLLAKVTWFTPNETEAAFFTGSSQKHDQEDPATTARKLMDQGVAGVVLKMGARGAYVAQATGFVHWQTPFDVRVVDTTAAGDAFNGAFATSLAMGLTAAESARFAAAAAALSVTRPGAQSSMPNYAEVNRLLQAVEV